MMLGPVCFTLEQWAAWTTAAKANPFAWPRHPLYYCEDCTEPYMDQMIGEGKCGRKDNKAVINWIRHGIRSHNTK